MRNMLWNGSILLARLCIVFMLLCSALTRQGLAAEVNLSHEPRESRSRRAKEGVDVFEVYNDVMDGSFSCSVCFYVRDAGKDGGDKRTCEYVPDGDRPVYLNFDMISSTAPFDFLCRRSRPHPNPDPDTDVQEIHEGVIDVSDIEYQMGGSREIYLSDHVVSQRLGITIRDKLSAAAHAEQEQEPGIGASASQVRVLNAINHHIPAKDEREAAVEADGKRAAEREKLHRKEAWRKTKEARKQAAPAAEGTGKAEPEAEAQP